MSENARQALAIPVLLAVVVALNLMVNRPRAPEPAPADAVAATPKTPPVAKAEPAPEPETEPEPIVEAPPAPTLDVEAIARAEAELDAAARDRALAEARAQDAKRALAASSTRAALEVSKGKKLAFRVRDPSVRIARASAKGGFLKAENEKLAKEVADLRSLPLPKPTPLLNKSPVARPANADEYHFELRRGRISFIDLERLLELAKADAQVKLRMADRMGVLSSQVGPVGSFSLAYVLGRAQSGIEELLERNSIRFDLRGWEIVPTIEGRGETYEATRNPISEYTRAINRLSPGRSVVTMWIYPDSFQLYRVLRDELSARGYSVAARPLPEGMTIRGSPMGSVSATQ
jgi:hypothetical protein